MLRAAINAGRMPRSEKSAASSLADPTLLRRAGMAPCARGLALGWMGVALGNPLGCRGERPLLVAPFSTELADV